jgi:hypothetical protein
MAVQTLPAFTPDGAVGAAFTGASSRVQLPGAQVGGTDTLVVVTNIGSLPVYVALGSSTVTAAVGTSFLVLPGRQRVFAIGTATYLAGIIQGASAYASGVSGICAIETGS